MIAGFRVVRFAGTGVREYHNLAFCMPSEDNNETTLIYADRKVTCAQYLLKKSVHVNVQNMLDMAHVRATIDRDRDALFEALRGEISDHAHAQVRLDTSRVPHHEPHFMSHFVSHVVSLCTGLHGARRADRASACGCGDADNRPPIARGRAVDHGGYSRCRHRQLQIDKLY